MIKQRMGNLPKVNTKIYRPFSILGLDNFGPFFIKNEGRKAIKKKTKGVDRLFHLCVKSRCTSRVGIRLRILIKEEIGSQRFIVITQLG